MKVTIFVEGGGDRQDVLTECRRGFATFIGKMLPGKAKPTVVSCGGRGEAYKDFCTAVGQLKDGERAILLVDSEDQVSPGDRPWKYLHDRAEDGWDKPEGADEEDACMMVQCMESWFLADPASVAAYYKNDFKRTKLPKAVNGSVEAVSKEKIEKGMKSATSETIKGTYHKRGHGFALLTVIQPELVIAASAHAGMLRDVLRKWLDDR